MSLEQKLESYYAKNASQADMHGWGLTKGKKKQGIKGGVMNYEDEIKKAVYGKGQLSGGVVDPRMSISSLLPLLMQSKIGQGLSGGTGTGGMMGYPSRYPGSFPMPGFYPAEQQMTESKQKDFMTGLGLSGGRVKRVKSAAKVAAGKKSARENPWLKKIAEYRKENGCSQKEAMIALGGKR